MPRKVIFAPEALTDLFELYDDVASASSTERARNHTDRIVTTSRNLVTFPEGGTPRDDLRPGLRTTTYRRFSHERSLSTREGSDARAEFKLRDDANCVNMRGLRNPLILAAKLLRLGWL